MKISDAEFIKDQETIRDTSNVVTLRLLARKYQDLTQKEMSRVVLHPISSPPEMILQHMTIGGAFLVRYVCDVPDGQLRVMVGKEPVGDNNELIWTVNGSVQRDGAEQSEYVRAPNEQELQAMRDLIPQVTEWDEPWEVSPESPGLVRIHAKKVGSFNPEIRNQHWSENNG